MEQNQMADLLAGALGGKVGEEGEIVADNVTFNEDTLPDTPSSDVMSGSGENAEPPKEPVDNTNNQKPDENQEKDKNSSLTKTFEELLAEKSGGKFKSWDEVEKASAPKTEFANDLVAKLNDFTKKFKDPNQGLDLFLKTQTTDFTQLDAADAIKMKMKMDNPELSDKEIDYEFKTTYKVDEDLYDEEVVEVSKAKMERESKKAIDELVAMQKELAINGDQNPAEIEAQKKAYEESKSNWEKNVDEAVSKLQDYEVKISDKDVLKWKFTEEEKTEAANLTKALHDNSAAFFDMFKGDDGKYDLAKISSAYLKIKRIDDIVAAAVKQATDAGAEKEIKELKNTSFEPAKGSKQDAPQSVEEQVATQFFKHF